MKDLRDKHDADVQDLKKIIQRNVEVINTDIG